MTGSREIALNTRSQQKDESCAKTLAISSLEAGRQFPLEPSRIARVCKMSKAQADSIRDMNTEELQKQIFVTPAEFAYLTGRSLKSVRNLMDRAQVPVHREGMPGSKRPKRFIMLQEYWESVAHCRALITPEEKHYIDRLMRDKATYRRATGNKHNALKRTSHSALQSSHRS